MCRTHEQVKAQMASQTASSSLDYVRQEQKGRQPRQNRKKQNPPQSQDKCRNCGLTHNGPECPAKGKKCLSCGKLNHFRSVCRSSRSKAANELQDEVCSAKTWDHDDTLLYLGDGHIQDTQPWTVPLVINNSKITFKVDSGADITCLPEAEYLRMRPRPGLEPKSRSLDSPGGRVECAGQFTASTTFKGKKYSFPVCVLKNSQSRLLSRSVSHGLGLLKFIEEVREDVFGNFGLLKGEPVRIRLRPDAPPYNLATPRRISAPLLGAMKE